MEDFVADCLNRVPHPVPPGEKDLTYDTCFSLFTSIAGAPDSSFHTPLQQQQECMDRARWRSFHARPPIMAIVEAKWRHWKPRRLKEESATTQRKLELHLRDRWAERIIGLLLPFAKDIPYLNAVNGENVHQEYLDLLEIPGSVPYEPIACALGTSRSWDSTSFLGRRVTSDPF